MPENKPKLEPRDSNIFISFTINQTVFTRRIYLDDKNFLEAWSFLQREVVQKMFPEIIENIRKK